MATDFTLESAAADATKGISEAVRIMDLMGRGQDARNLDVYRNNLEAALRIKSELDEAATIFKSGLDDLEAIRGMLAGYAGQPNLMGDVFKIADAALSGRDCPGHVARDDDRKVCRHCGTHVDSLRDESLSA